MDYKVYFGGIAVVLGIVSYLPYFRDTFAKKTKPHVFSWFLWSMLAFMGFFAQMVEGAGSGAWVTGITSVLCLFVAMLAFHSRKDHIVKLDVYCFIGALLGIIIWKMTSEPVTAVIIVSLVDAIAFLPTFRKAYHKPFEETAITFEISTLKWFLAVLALQSFSITTWLYPASLVLTNGLFVTMLIVRRAQLHSRAI